MSSFSVSSSTPTALRTPGTVATRPSWASVRELWRMSETFLCATVKSAAPTCRTPAAVVRTLSVTTPSATTVITPTATAKAVSADRTFLTETLWKISQGNDMAFLLAVATGSVSGSRRAPLYPGDERAVNASSCHLTT